eukprot:TRINITY_DN5730_c0_g8_i1.p1 TRINITY_DN5730_c0_g8~~TRINITY_DN5730_c0_g8_i1.p1  ORF type:complete len:823 (+),score=197.71 TRINITY_DN5730_c0_g8_i1:87-2555(+)
MASAAPRPARPAEDSDEEEVVPLRKRPRADPQTPTQPSQHTQPTQPTQPTQQPVAAAAAAAPPRLADVVSISDGSESGDAGAPPARGERAPAAPAEPTGIGALREALLQLPPGIEAEAAVARLAGQPRWAAVDWSVQQLLVSDLLAELAAERAAAAQVQPERIPRTPSSRAAAAATVAAPAPAAAAAAAPAAARAPAAAAAAAVRRGGGHDAASEAKAALAAVRSELRQVRKQMQQLRDKEQGLREQEIQLVEQLEEVAATRRRAEAAEQDWRAPQVWDDAVNRCQEAINAVLSSRDCFAIMPTGSGKSLCFQLPAALWGHMSGPAGGVTVVISPLVSLMCDQLQAVRRLGIDARIIYGETAPEDRRATLNALGQGSLAMVYVTPEFIAKSKQALAKLQQAFRAQRLRLFVIDEVHCCSQWGHDFRPDYRKLGVLRQNFPGVPILALTATATQRCCRDVEAQLHIRGCLMLRGHYNRANLRYAVAAKPEGAKDELDWMAEFIATRWPTSSGIVYCLSCRDVENVASGLAQRGVAARAYHAQLPAPDRHRTHEQWSAGRVRVIVATIAFGMGIDKPDVRFVIHHSLPKSVENWYQESGRAGRDGRPSDCVVLYRPNDVQRLTSLSADSPNRDHAQGLVYELSRCLDGGGRACRRQALARYFGDEWRPADCSAACDICAARASGASGGARGCDITGLAYGVLTTFAAAEATAQKAGKKEGTRLTILKAVELARSDTAWAKTARGSAAAPQACKQATPREVEQAVVRLLTEGLLEEEFQFNAYSAQSYLVLKPEGWSAARGKLQAMRRVAATQLPAPKDIPWGPR